jgi:hypothetical protein
MESLHPPPDDAWWTRHQHAVADDAAIEAHIAVADLLTLASLASECADPELLARVHEAVTYARSHASAASNYGDLPRGWGGT